MKEKFLEYFQNKVVKGRPTTLQELAINAIFNDARLMDFLTTRGVGKTTLFNALEGFFGAKPIVNVPAPKPTEPPKK